MTEDRQSVNENIPEPEGDIFRELQTQDTDFIIT